MSPPLVAVAAYAVSAAALAPFLALTPSAGAAENLFRNGGFEVTVPENNLWDGVTTDGYLAGASFSMDAISDNGFRSVALPPSVAVADLNGDGKPDLLTADPGGTFRFYENVGTITEPRFTSAEVLPLFLSLSTGKWDPNLRTWSPQPARAMHPRCSPRIALADWRRTGSLDLLVGNYLGELLFLPNSGSARAPSFRQPRMLESALLRTNPRAQLTANLLAPAAGAWTGAGHTDLVLGEGTYSANVVRLLENIGSGGSAPQFSEERSWPLAYGDGKEMLIPTVVDFDGDGRPDLIVADRTGQVSVYLNPGASWKPGQELPLVSKITFGGSDRLPGLVSVCAADFNHDGLFDLILGLPNGHVAVALNTGSRGQPKFGPIQELRGDKRLAPWLRPPEWKLDSNTPAGNLLSYLAAMDAASDPESKPPEGSHCLKAGYWPAGNKVFSAPYEVTEPENRRFEFHQDDILLEVGKNYSLSFKVKGGGVEKLRYFLRAKVRSSVQQQVRIDKLERGVRKIPSGSAEPDATFEQTGEATAGSGAWTTVSRSFTFRTSGRDLPKGTKVNLNFRVEFVLARPEAAGYFDDFQLVEQGR